MISILYNTVRPGGVDILYNNLIKQTIQDFELIFVDGWKGERELEVKEYLKDFKLIYLKGLPKKEGDVWTLNKDYNLGLSACSGELIVFIQDYIWLPPNGLERFLDHYRDYPQALVSGVGHKTSLPNVKEKPQGKISIFGDDYVGVPTGISEADSRIDGESGQYEVDYSKWEMNFASCPKAILDEIGGFDEDMDQHFGGDNVIVAAKAAMIGCKFILDKDLINLGYNQSALFPRQADWDLKHSNTGYLNKKLCKIISRE